MARASLVVLAIVVVITSSVAGAEPEQDLDGIYACEGTNPDGTAYKGMVEMVSDGDIVHVRWTFEGSEMVGVGIRRDDVLAVSYFIGAPALAVYKIQQGSDRKSTHLSGTWTIAGVGGELFSETLTKLKLHGRIDPASFRAIHYFPRVPRGRAGSPGTVGGPVI